MRLICKNPFNKEGRLTKDGEVLIEVYLEEGKGMIDGDTECFDEVYVFDHTTKKTVWLDECEHMDTTYEDLYYYALDYLQAEYLEVEEA